MEEMLWPILLLLVGMAIVVLEIFIPSGGVLGVLAVAAIVASLVLAFSVSIRSGLVVLVLVFVLTPLTVGYAFRLWPKTPIGKKILGVDLPTAEETLPASQLPELLGQYGTAHTDLWPNGEVLIDGQRYTALSEGKPIDAGESIRVIAVRMNRLIVSDHPSPPPPEKQEVEEDPLARPVDEIVSDPFGDPLV
ncbi:MAG: NfeD family protein [Planctomycetota bacterium]|nr:NfeD family protein [Planctomycetota bacterium]